MYNNTINFNEFCFEMDRMREQFEESNRRFEEEHTRLQDEYRIIQEQSRLVDVQFNSMMADLGML